MEESKKKSGFATAGLVLGVIGICTSFMPIINNLSFILALIGILFGIISLLKKASKGQAVAGIIFCILAIIITINAQKTLADSINDSLNTMSKDLDKMSGNSTEEILEKDVDVVLGEFTATKASYGITETKLQVTVTNKTQETKSFNIQIEAINPDGSRINTDYVYANNLTAGQSQSFDTFTYVSSENLEAMKNATFKIVQASMY